jgi:adenosine deaminase
MTLPEIKHVVLNGFKAAFLPFHQRQDYVRRIALELSHYHEDGTIAPQNGQIEEPAKGSLYPAHV